MIAKIYVTLKEGILDPQGKAVQRSLATLGFDQIQDVRIGKYIEVKLKDALSKSEAKKEIDDMCRKLLSNEVIENYRFDLLDGTQ